MNTLSVAGLHPIFRGLILSGLVGMMLATTAFAQPGRAPGLSADDQAKVDSAQVRIVAADLKLDAEKTEKLQTAYIAFQEETRKNPPPRPERGNFEAMRAAQQERLSTLQTSLSTFLDEAQAADAAQTLAGRNRGWDTMTLTIMGFGLESAKENEALGHTLAYVKGTRFDQSEPSSRPDFEALRTTMLNAKKALDEKLAPLLTEEQKTTWSEKTDWRSRGSRGGDRGDRGNRGDRAERRGGAPSE